MFDGYKKAESVDQTDVKERERASEKEKLLKELDVQKKASEAEQLKHQGIYDAHLRDANAAALMGEGKAADALRQKADESKKEMEIAASKVVMMTACLEAMQERKNFDELSTVSHTERKRLNNYTAATAWSFSRLWAKVGAQPQTTTTLLVERVMKYLNPLYSAAIEAARSDGSAELEYSLLHRDKKYMELHH